MTRIFSAIVALFAGLTLSVVAAQAQQNGPYYAMPSWDQTIPAAQRFVVLANFNSEAVLDRVTGLVWERTPGHTTLGGDAPNWSEALSLCHSVSTGGYFGWRLPTVEELGSLTPLPDGHPFLAVPDFFWAASTVETDTTLAYVMRVGTSGHSGIGSNLKAATETAWCVRGGSAVTNPIN